jgi:hypothetical protein
MKRLPLLVLAVLGLSLAACGDDGGGGDEAAFCDGLETLSDQVADGDLASNDGLEDVVETMNELIETAGDDQLETVEDVANDLADASAGDAGDSAEAVQDELGGFAEDCDIDDDEFAIPETTTTTEVEEPSTTTTVVIDDPSTTTTDTAPPGDEVLVVARQPVPGDIAPEFAALAEACFAGDMAACDQLFAETPIGSVDEDYGRSCGGRVEDAVAGQCQATITGPVAVPADVVDQATAAACEAGDMIACDDLFRAAADGSVDQAYGALCAGRVPDTNAFCVDIFGEVAFV